MKSQTLPAEAREQGCRTVNQGVSGLARRSAWDGVARLSEDGDRMSPSVKQNVEHGRLDSNGHDLTDEVSPAEILW
jgi:hypothetical protein